MYTVKSRPPLALEQQVYSNNDNVSEVWLGAVPVGRPHLPKLGKYINNNYTVFTEKNILIILIPY